MARVAPNGTPVVVQTGASIIVEDHMGRILMQQRADDGTWSYPGGRVEIDETVEDGARREVREECGLEVGALRLLGVFSGKELNHVYPNGNEVCGVDIVYVSNDFTGHLQSVDGEAKRIGFYPIDALPQPISPMNAKQLQAYLETRETDPL
ncbi:MAG: NUDIX domain-containing protein [Faecousia sp.]